MHSMSNHFGLKNKTRMQSIHKVIDKIILKIWWKQQIEDMKFFKKFYTLYLHYIHCDSYTVIYTNMYISKIWFNTACILN